MWNFNFSSQYIYFSDLTTNQKWNKNLSEDSSFDDNVNDYWNDWEVQDNININVASLYKISTAQDVVMLLTNIFE